jgi:hypothetical protein
MIKNKVLIFFNVLVLVFCGVETMFGIITF